MADGHGGPRTPAKPAPVSGPGAGSRRTDGGPAQALRSLPDAKYGENKEFMGLQQAAGLAQAGGGPPAPSAAGGPGGGGAPQGNPPSAPVPLTAGTLRPNEPVTAGIDSGPGPGSSTLQLPDTTQAAWRTGRDAITAIAQSPSASPAVVALAARLKGAF